MKVLWGPRIKTLNMSSENYTNYRRTMVPWYVMVCQLFIEHQHPRQQNESISTVAGCIRNTQTIALGRQQWQFLITQDINAKTLCQLLDIMSESSLRRYTTTSWERKKQMSKEIASKMLQIVQHYNKYTHPSGHICDPSLLYEANLWPFFVIQSAW